MTAGSEQIVRAFEALGLTPEQIAEQEELDVLSIKACLMQFSTKYRNLCKSETNGALVSSGKISDSGCSDNVVTTHRIGFTDHQEQMALDTIANLAAYSDNEQVQLRASEYIRDDRQGRLDFATKMGNLNINVFSFNEQLKRAMQVVQSAKAPLEIEAEAISE